MVVYTSMPKQPLICNRKGIQAVDCNKPASNRFYLLKLPPPHRIRTQASNDTEAGILSGVSQKRLHVHKPIGSRNSATHNVYHTSLRPSSVFEPRHPSLKVLSFSKRRRFYKKTKGEER